MAYKIAVVTEDGQRIGNHFGMAPNYQVFSVDGGRILSQETRSKPHHSQHPDHSAQEHGVQEQDHNRLHEDMFAPIKDCQVLMCGGMGSPAYQKAIAAGLKVVMTSGEIQPSVKAFMDGNVTSDLSRIHQH